MYYTSLRYIVYTSPSLLLRSLRSRHLRSLQLDSLCLHHLPDEEENSDFFTIVDDKDDVEAITDYLDAFEEDEDANVDDRDAISDDVLQLLMTRMLLWVMWLGLGMMRILLKQFLRF